MKSIAIILASGTGERFGAHVPKQFLKLAGRSVIEHTLEAFENHAKIDEIIVVSASQNHSLINEIILKNAYRKVSKLIHGGATRQLSSAAGIGAVDGDEHKVLVHDAVRPLVDAATISRCLEALESADAVDTAIPASDTVIQLAADSTIAQIPDRSTLRLGQTPQAFRSGLLRRAHQLAARDPELRVSDDCGLILHYQLGKVHVVAGDTSNIKITYPLDIYLADRLFQLRTRSDEDGTLALPTLNDKHIVIFGASRGIGQHVHQIAEAAGAKVVAVSRADGVDVCDEHAVRRTLDEAVARHGPVDAVVLTAGLLRTGLLVGQSYETIDQQIITNLRGSIVVAREAFEVMRDHGGSIALFTSSSYTRGRARSSVYSATKAAVVNLMQGLSEEFRPFNVRINAINPERTATPMRTENFGREPVELLLDPDEVARVTLNACLSNATGEIIDVRL